MIIVLNGTDVETELCLDIKKSCDCRSCSLCGDDYAEALGIELELRAALAPAEPVAPDDDLPLPLVSPLTREEIEEIGREQDGIILVELDEDEAPAEPADNTDDGPHDFLVDLDVVNGWNALAAAAELASRLDWEAELQDREEDRWQAEEDYRAWLDAIETDREAEWHEDEVRAAGQRVTIGWEG